MSKLTMWMTCHESDDDHTRFIHAMEQMLVWPAWLLRYTDAICMQHRAVLSLVDVFRGMCGLVYQSQHEQCIVQDEEWLVCITS